MTLKSIMWDMLFLNVYVLCDIYLNHSIGVISDLIIIGDWLFGDICLNNCYDDVLILELL
jgi:hypothetical protein